MSEKSNFRENHWGQQWVQERDKPEEGRRKLEKIMTGDKVWIPVALLFILLCVLTWVNEIFNLYHHIFGITHIPVNWDEALSETIIIAGVGVLSLTILSRSIRKGRAAERELREYQQHLEETVARRTLTLQHMVDAMAGRVVRVSELQMAVQVLRVQLKEAGLEPTADLPPPAENKQPESSPSVDNP